VSYNALKLLSAVIVALMLEMLLPTPLHASSLTLNWTDNSGREDGTAIDRKLGATGTFAEIGRVGEDVVTYIDKPDLKFKTTYCYRVRAFNTAGLSGYSNEACGTTPDDIGLPNDPSALQISVTITITVPLPPP